MIAISLCVLEKHTLAAARGTLPVGRKGTMIVEVFELRTGVRQYTFISPEHGFHSLIVNAQLRDGVSWNEQEPKIIAMAAAVIGLPGHDIEDNLEIVRRGQSVSPDAATARLATV